MKTLQNGSSYLLGLVTFFAPKVTDSLKTALQKVIADMRTEGLTYQANELMYSQQQQIAIDETEIAIKWIGIAISIIAAFFLYLKDIEAIHRGAHYFCTRTRHFWSALKNGFTKRCLNVSQKAKTLLKRVKTHFSKHTHNH